MIIDLKNIYSICVSLWDRSLTSKTLIPLSDLDYICCLESSLDESEN